MDPQQCEDFLDCARKKGEFDVFLWVNLGAIWFAKGRKFAFNSEQQLGKQTSVTGREFDKHPSLSKFSIPQRGHETQLFHFKDGWEWKSTYSSPNPGVASTNSSVAASDMWSALAKEWELPSHSETVAKRCFRTLKARSLMCFLFFLCFDFVDFC